MSGIEIESSIDSDSDTDLLFLRQLNTDDASSNDVNQ